MLWEEKIKLDNVFTLQPARPVTYFGVGALDKIDEVVSSLKKRFNVKKVIVITDSVVYKVTGAWDKVRPALEKHDVEYIIYEKVRPNPTYANCDEAARIAKEAGADAVLAIGGGSHIDTAKTVAALLKNPGVTAQELYEKIIVVEDAVPLVAINTTHGTGSEVDKFAVAQSDKRYKPLIMGPGIYPTYSIEDPVLTKTLPLKHTIATSLDALNHVFEATTTLTRNPYSTELGLRAAELIYRWLPVAIREPDNIRARYWLMYASAIAGISFDIGLLHLTHALEHPLSAIKPEVVHGLGLSALLPSIAKITCRVLPEVCAEFFHPIMPDLRGVPGEAEDIAVRLEKWLASVGAPYKLRDLGFSEDDIPALVENAMTSPMSPALFKVAPVEVTEELVRKIYLESLDPLSK